MPRIFVAFEPPDSPAAERRVRRVLLRRLLVFLAAGLVTFTMISWLLVRDGDPLSLLASEAGPINVVRAHLAALDRGELRAAYALFSPRYRQQVPFEAYHDLVVTHWRMFQTRELRFSRREAAAGRVVLETRTRGEGGGRYIAEFTLVRSGSRWWIDDLRWGAERESRGLLFA